MKKTKDSVKHSKNKYHVKNWSEYNKALIKRGSLTLWISDDIGDWWNGEGHDTYSDKAIETSLVLKAIYRLPLRATVGMIQSIFQLSGIKLSTPDYTTMSRRGKKSNVVLRSSGKNSTDIILDSTGAKVFGEGEWKVRKHGWGKRRTWKKF